VKTILSKFLAYGLHASVALFAAAMITLGLLAPEAEHSGAYVGLGIGGILLIAGMVGIRRMVERAALKEDGNKS
jgi:hypothetical protein